MEKLQFVYKFSVTINSKDRTHNIKTKTFFIDSELCDLLILRGYDDSQFSYAVSFQDYDSMLNKNQLTDIRIKVAKEIDAVYIPNKSFNFELWFKSDEHVKEFQCTDMLIAMIKTHLIKKRLGM